MELELNFTLTDNKGKHIWLTWLNVIYGFLVSKETVVLRRLKKNLVYSKRVDIGWITTVKDLESWRFER